MYPGGCLLSTNKKITWGSGLLCTPTVDKIVSYIECEILVFTGIPVFLLRFSSFFFFFDLSPLSNVLYINVYVHTQRYNIAIIR